MPFTSLDCTDPIHVPDRLKSAAEYFRKCADAEEFERGDPAMASDWRCVANILDEEAHHIGTQIAMQRLIRRHSRRHGEPANDAARSVLDLAASIAVGTR